MWAMRLLVTGAAGMLGTDVVAAASAGHDVVALARADLDITDAEAVRAAVRDTRPDAVINCAAWTDVDGAEAAEAQATLVNGDGAGHVAAAAAEAGAHSVHVSSDYVFAGDAASPYLEADPTGPIGAYGRSKLAGELAVAAAAPAAHAIVRTAWLFGPHGKNFVDTMLRLGARARRGHGRRRPARLPDVHRPPRGGAGPDRAGAHARRAARRRRRLAAHGGSSPARRSSAPASTVTVHRGSTADLRRPAPRPAYSVLGSTRSDAPVLPAWQAGLAAHLVAGLADRRGVAATGAGPEGRILA